MITVLAYEGWAHFAESREAIARAFDDGENRASCALVGTRRDDCCAAVADLCEDKKALF